MSESHKKYLPIIAGHVDGIGYTHGMIEAHLGPKGERADYWAVCRNPVAEAFAEHPECVKGDRRMVSLFHGSTSTHELKVSVADLRADQDKPWRKPGVHALGQRRWYWLLKGGEVRPEHVHDACGWGVVVFDEEGYEIAKPSARFVKVDRAGEIELAMRIIERKYKDWGRHLQFGRASDVLPPAQATEPTPAKIDQRPTRLPAHIQYIRDFLDIGPASTSQLRRHLLHEHGVDIKPKKLATELDKHKQLFKQDGAGGSWSLRKDAADEAPCH